MSAEVAKFHLSVCMATWRPTGYIQLRRNILHHGGSVIHACQSIYQRSDTTKHFRQFDGIPGLVSELVLYVRSDLLDDARWQLQSASVGP